MLWLDGVMIMGSRLIHLVHVGVGGEQYLPFLFLTCLNDIGKMVAPIIDE